MAMVCLCHGVNERRIRREIDRGACTIEAIAAHCGAGDCCQNCKRRHGAPPLPLRLIPYDPSDAW